MTAVTVLCPVSYADLRVGPTETLVWCPRCAVHHDREFLADRDETLCSCGHRLAAHGPRYGLAYACPLATCNCNTKPKENDMADLPYDHETLAREIARDLIFNGARDVEYLTITEKLADLDADEEIPVDAFDVICGHASELISKATVTVELAPSDNPLIAAKETTS